MPGAEPGGGGILGFLFEHEAGNGAGGMQLEILLDRQRRFGEDKGALLEAGGKFVAAAGDGADDSGGTFALVEGLP